MSMYGVCVDMSVCVFEEGMYKVIKAMFTISTSET